MLIKKKLSDTLQIKVWTTFDLSQLSSSRKVLLPCNLDVVMRWFGHEELSWDLHLSRLCREVAEEATLLLDEEELGQLLGLGLQNLNPLLQLGNQIVELHGAWHTEVEV